MIAPIRDKKGIIINYVGVKHDISEQKKAEEALLLSEKELREAVSTKNKFFSIIAHDLKGPFNTLLGFSELLLNGFDDNTNEQNYEIIEVLNHSSNKAYNLLSELLTWSRMQMGKMKYRPEFFELKSLVTESLGYLTESALKKEVELINRIEPQTVYADKDAISSVIRNLVSNAIKYSYRRSKVVVYTELRTPKTLVVKVKDSGIGISADKANNLFKIETNISTVGTEKEDGTGLGLILCKEFLHLSKQDIFVESKPGHGTTFSFTLALQAD